MSGTTSFVPCFFCSKPTRHAVPVNGGFVARCGGCKDKTPPEDPLAVAEHSQAVKKRLGLTELAAAVGMLGGSR